MSAMVIKDYETSIRAKVEWIDPKKAIKLLETVEDNRRVKQATVSFYAHEIRTGQWVVNGQGIIIDEDGRMIDGQHRCWSVVETGTGVPILVVRGVSRDVFDTLDTGMVRSTEDVVGISFDMTGTRHARALAVAGRSLMCMNSKNPQYNAMGANRRFTHREVTDYVRDHKTLLDSVEWILSFPSRGLPMSVGSLVAMHTEMCKLDFDVANDFMQKVITGQNLQHGDAELVLREVFASRDKRRQKWTALERTRMLAKAWNARARGGLITQRNVRLRVDEPRFIPLRRPRSSLDSIA